MTGQVDPIVQSAERLCETLERLGDALVALDVDTLLETEETLGQLLAAIGRASQSEDRTALERLIERGRAALVHCRLGGVFTSVARSRLPLHTGIETYGRDGEYVELAEVPSLAHLSVGAGVDVVAVRTARASLIEARIRVETPRHHVKAP